MMDPISVKLLYLQRATQLCDRHEPTGASRSGCVICNLTSEARAFSRIDYLLGAPNEMEVSGYDIHCDEDAVVKRLEAFIEHVMLSQPSIVASFREQNR